MRQEKISLVLGSLALALLANCGNTNMSGAIGPRKEKTDKSGARKATSPAVVTGTYLTCDYSPTDNTQGKEAVGCSMMANGAQVTPTADNKLAFYSSFQNGAYKTPNQSNTSSGHQALFLASPTDIPKTKYIATLANQWGMDEFSCDQLPCRQPVTLHPKPTYLALVPASSGSRSPAAAIWSMDTLYINAVDFVPGGHLNFIDPSLYCSKRKSDLFLSGTNPGQTYILGTAIPSVLSRHSIEKTQQLYAQVSQFEKHKLKDGTYFAANSDCIVLSLKRKSGAGDFFINQMAASGPKVTTDRFHVIIRNSTENLKIAEEFLKAIPDN